MLETSSDPGNTFLGVENRRSFGPTSPLSRPSELQRFPSRLAASVCLKHDGTTEDGEWVVLEDFCHRGAQNICLAAVLRGWSTSTCLPPNLSTPTSPQFPVLSDAHRFQQITWDLLGTEPYVCPTHTEIAWTPARSRLSIQM